ncbi:MAG: phosphoribosylformylglycinamidine synthase subunit PurQ [Gemmataceae bacterium]
MATPSALILRSPGANCDIETQFAFEQAGAIADRVHINRLREQPALLHKYQILVIPGGFSYGDDVAGGKILANQLRHLLAETIQEFRDLDRLILGICNGFQALLKAGLIVPPDEDGPLVTLTHNDSGRYEDRWVHLSVNADKSPFLVDDAPMYLPVAHGEGKIKYREEWIGMGLTQSGQALLKYVGPDGKPGDFPVNPNGSEEHTAGLCDATGRVFGLMPHPERYVLPTHHPRWTRLGLSEEPDGLRIFRNAVQYFE